MAVDVDSTSAVSIAIGDDGAQSPGFHDESDSCTTDYDAAAREAVDGVTAACPRGTRIAVYVGVAIVVVLGALNGWLFYRWDQSRVEQHQRAAFLAAARQAALNLTTIDYLEVEADVARILGSSTGAFHNDFEGRSQAFIDVVKKVRSKSVGTITEAGVESVHDGQAQVLVAVSAKTTTPAAPDDPPRLWRMQIDVQQMGDVIKVANVVFVP